jgi:Eukaryotic aspartyl protease
VDTLHKTIKVKIDANMLNSGKGVIVDSGTTDTYLSRTAAYEFNRAWKTATGMTYSHTPMALTKQQLWSLPTVLIQCHSGSYQRDPTVDSYDIIPGYTGVLDFNAPNDLLIAIPATSYMDYSPITKMYTSRLYFTETVGGVLGSNTMLGYNVVFDWENGRIGFAESSCTYDKSAIPKSAKDDGYASDCQVGQPILSKSCLQTVDERMCALNPTHIALLGTEMWSAIVESAGIDSGRSCVDAAREMSHGKSMLDIQTVCRGNGLCEEIRPCQMTCAELAKAKEIVPAMPSENAKRGCGDTLWSTCDYGCTQTRLKSIAYTDGTCHEVSRENRTCHIGACARSDPCRVPFLVHAIFVFPGASASLWNDRTEDNFIAALTLAASKSNSTLLFGEGDVDLLLAIPWHPDEDDPDMLPGDGHTGTQGLKVVLEISIYNHQAAFGNSTQSALATSDSRVKGVFGTSIANKTGDGSIVRDKCVSSNLFDLASQVVVLKNQVLSSRVFMDRLLQELQTTETQFTHNYVQSPFVPLFHNASMASASHLLSAWIVRTLIPDEVNYLGPPRPMWLRVVAVVHFGLTIVFCALILLTLISTISAWSGNMGEIWAAIRTRIPMRRLQWTRVSTTACVDSDAEEVIMGSIEMAVPRSRAGTVATKRKKATSP